MKLARVFGTVLTALPAFAATAQPLIVAHRGSSYTAPENTVSAAKLGWKQKADVLEVDVHLSADNRVMVLHDSGTSRTTGVSSKVSKTTSDKLRKLDAGSWKNARYAGEKIPFLEEMLATVPADKKVFVEIKSSEETVPYVRDVLKETDKMEQAVIIGFDLDTVTTAKVAMPQVPVYWLKSTEKKKETKEPIPHSLDLIQTVKERKLDGLDLQYEGVTKELVEAAHAAGLELHVWTVDDPKAARRLKEMGVDSITTNRPALIRKALESKDSSGEQPAKKKGAKKKRGKKNKQG